MERGIREKEEGRKERKEGRKGGRKGGRKEGRREEGWMDGREEGYGCYEWYVDERAKHSTSCGCGGV